MGSEGLEGDFEEDVRIGIRFVDERVGIEGRAYDCAVIVPIIDLVDRCAIGWFDNSLGFLGTDGCWT